jgi:hypothetical protein
MNAWQTGSHKRKRDSAKQVPTHRNPSSMFRAIEERGMSYAQIKQIVTLDIPQWTLRFSQVFRNKTIRQASREVDKERKTLERMKLIPESVVRESAQHFAGLDLVIANSLLETNATNRGRWRLSFLYATPDHDNPTPMDGKMYLEASQTNPDEGSAPERRLVEIDPQGFVKSMRKALQEALTQLGIADELEFAPAALTSGRQRYAWPIYSRFVVPRLYEYMLPFYSSKAHYSELLDQLKPERTARYPKALFEDMLAILQLEHPDDFQLATPAKLTAFIQTYYRQRPKNMKSPKAGVP